MQQAGLRVGHLDVRRPLELGHEAEASRGPIEGAPPLVVARVEDAVEERDVRRVHAALERLEVVAVLPELGDEPLGLRHQRPLEIGQAGRRAGRPHVRPDDAAALGARVGGQGDLVLEVRLRPLVGHVDAAAIRLVLPAVVDAAQAALLVAREVEGGAPVGAELGQQTGAPARGAVGHQVLAQDPHALDPTARRQLGRQHHGDPVLPHQIADERPRSHLRQLRVLFGGQHRRHLLRTEGMAGGLDPVRLP